jgi:hypothetical protein
MPLSVNAHNSTVFKLSAMTCDVATRFLICRNFYSRDHETAVTHFAHGLWTVIGAITELIDHMNP